MSAASKNINHRAEITAAWQEFKARFKAATGAGSATPAPVLIEAQAEKTGNISNSPVQPSSSDRESWFDAALERDDTELVSDLIYASVREHVIKNNPVHWRSLQRELAWFTKECRKFGIAEDHVRYYL